MLTFNYLVELWLQQMFEWKVDDETNKPMFYEMT